VGAAKVQFALPAHVPLAGYSRRKGKPSTGVHDPVWARALVLRQGSTTVVLVSGDLLIIDEILKAAVEARMRRLDGLREAVLMVTATHTHSGPGAYGRKFFEKVSMGHFDPVVFNGLVDSLEQAIERAVAVLQPVAMVATASTTTTGLVRNRMDSNGVVDADLTVVTWLRADGQPVAILASFAAHPTILSASNRELSADYPGVLAAEVERVFPSAVCLFMAGLVGDQAPIKSGPMFETTHRIGTQLADHVVALIRAASPQPPTRLQAQQRIMPLPAARVRLGHQTLPSWLSQLFVDDDATLTVVRFDHTVILGAPCDMTAELGLGLKHELQTRGWQPLLISFADDYIGYCLSETRYRTRQYEALMAFNGPKTGSMVVNELARMLDQLDEPQATSNKWQGKTNHAE